MKSTTDNPKISEKENNLSLKKSFQNLKCLF